MDYKVMKRPMFRVGGPTSGGTGITSGLDTPKRGLVDGPGEYSKTYEEYRDAIGPAFQKRKTGLENQMGSIGPMALYQALSGGALEGVSDFGDLAMAFGNPAVLQSVVSGMGAKNKLQSSLDDVDLKEATTMATLLKPASRTGSEKVYNIKKQDLKDVNKLLLPAKKTYAALSETDKKTEEGLKIYESILILEERKNLIMSTYSTDAELRERFVNAMVSGGGDRPSDNEIARYIKSVRGYGLAEGGRINKQMGGGFDMAQAPENMAPGLETTQPEQPQQDPYMILREKLPPEIPNEVVQLIAYNKEAFQDFANIQTQDDVDLFNQKYNVQLVVDMASA